MVIVRRPRVHPRIDPILTEIFSPSDHESFWDAEARSLGGLSPREALDMGEIESLIALLEGRGNNDRPFISPERAEAYLRSARLGANDTP